MGHCVTRRARGSRPTTTSPIWTRCSRRSTRRSASSRSVLRRWLERARATALTGSRGVIGHVLGPELDHISVRVGDVDRPVGDELDRALDLDPGGPQALEQRVERVALEVEGEVHVRTAAAPGQPDLWRPQAEPGGRADEIPAAIVAALAVMRLLKAEPVAI